VLPLSAPRADRARHHAGGLHGRRPQGYGPTAAGRDHHRRAAGRNPYDQENGQRLRLRQPGWRMTDLTALTLVEARDGLRKKEFSAAELADAHLFAMEQARALNAYVLETPERAGAMAKRADARIAKGEAGPLEGIPLAVKDMFCTEGVRTTACSRILDNFVPTYESTVSAQLWRDGGVLLGKTNNDEFAMGSSDASS